MTSPEQTKIPSQGIGDPYTVRLIYFRPKGLATDTSVVNKMKTTIVEAQNFYRNQMPNSRTFQYEKDSQGLAKVHIVEGERTETDLGGSTRSYYNSNTGTKIANEVHDLGFLVTDNVYFIVFHNINVGVFSPDGSRLRGVANEVQKGGAAIVDEDYTMATVTHELGHAFGLYHDFRDYSYMMSYGGSRVDKVSECNKQFLSIDTYFNASSRQSSYSPIISLTSSLGYAEGALSHQLNFNAESSNNLFLAMLHYGTESDRGNKTIKQCVSLSGTRDTITIEYDGKIPSANNPTGSGTSLYNPKEHTISMRVLNEYGVFTEEFYRLRQDQNIPIIIHARGFALEKEDETFFKYFNYIIDTNYGKKDYLKVYESQTTPLISMTLLDTQDDSITSGDISAFTVTTEIGNTGIANIEHDTSDSLKTKFKLNGIREGETNIKFVVAHGEHIDFETMPIRIVVSKPILLYGDFNRDGVVDYADYLIFLGYNGLNQIDNVLTISYFDSNNDGQIDDQDIDIFLSNYGKSNTGELPITATTQSILEMKTALQRKFTLHAFKGN